MKRLVLLIPLLYIVFNENYVLAKPQTNKFINNTFKIVMVRHGESEWNQKNLFTGWYDTKLSPKGIQEAITAGKTLKEGKYEFDSAHISMLTRTEETLNNIIKELGQTDICVFKTWRLNERHYGSLTGLNKAEVAAKYGDDKVTIWRRSFDVSPPAMSKSHPYYKEIVTDPRYAKEPADYDFPIHETLKETIKRTLPYWNKVIIPQLLRGRRILIVAHGNSLRGIVKHLDNISDKAIVDVNLPTGIPFEYTLDDDLKPLVSMKFLGDKEVVRKALEAMATPGKPKKTQ